MGDNSTPERVTVLVTGFGPFAMHVVNASWMAVAELAKIGLGKDAHNIDLVTKEIPVEYKTVSELIPQLWDIFKPQLMVHVGVSGVTKHLTLEQKAFNIGYNREDTCGCVPNDECCINGADDSIVSEIDMNLICDFVNNSQSNVMAIVSNDPGRYLCDFIYFTSLSINKKCTAFIHVPPLDSPYSVGELAEGIRLSILAMLEHLKLI